MSVSVIIPNYNHAPFLKQRIDSVLDQTYQDIELILLDDCSTDDSRTVLAGYEHHPKVKTVVYNEVNSGSISRQWQKGLSLATSPFIWIAESDDYADPGFLETMMAALEKDVEVGFVYCDNYIVDEQGQPGPLTSGQVRNRDLGVNKWSESYKNDGKNEIRENLLKDCTVTNVSGVLFRKSAITSVNPFDIDLKIIGDWYCYLKLCNSFKIAYINKPLNYFRSHANNTSKTLRRSDAHIREFFLLFDWAWRELKFISPSIILRHFKYYTRHSLIKNTRNRPKLYSELYKLNRRLYFSMLSHNAYTAISERFNKK